MSGDGLPLSLSGVTMRWPGADEPVLDSVDLVVAPGTTVEIEAANGAGKTTLVRIAAGLIRPEQGHVRLGPLDAEVDRTAFQRRIGSLSAASTGLYARLTARDHLRLWSALALMPPVERSSACERVIEALNLPTLLDRRVDRLSMGQRQRVRLAGAFLHEPDVVLLDEPTNSLDQEGVSLVAAELERMRAQGGAALWCTPLGARDMLAPDLRLTIASGRVVAT